MKLKGLPIWTKFDVSMLGKLALQFRGDPPMFGEITYLNNMLSDARILTHLHLTIERTHSTIFLNLIQYTWPNLENLVINATIGLVLTGVYQNPSDFVNFFKRHTNLTTLSLSSNIFPRVPSLTPYITVDHLPRLESFSYDIPMDFEGLQLNQVLSPASARRLRHLTISEKDAQYSNMDIYKELTSLQSCCITPQSIISLDYNNIYRILGSIVGHATNLRKIYLPPHVVLSEGLQEEHFMTLSFLRDLPSLTHLSGLWMTSILDSELTWRRLSQELHHFDKLRFVIPDRISLMDEEKQILFFELARDRKGKLMAEAVLGRILPSDMGYLSWGGFYRGMINEV
ncbi:hypothetical protein Clacol_001233 [Clathrus columnatus]|uniref:Uncharacterized protein n=1 Tax=Clathrus columnatus TaxID=1419009 RepID=A0AAV4ZYQ8_9AGAM|nr:hypothetical protein Clacol_001233 [Clathrus columnatus]